MPESGSMSANDAAQAEDACGMLSGLDPSLSVRRGSVSGRRASMSRAPLVDANQRAKELIVKWGAHDVKGLDPKRAEAIGLTPLVFRVGYAPGGDSLPQLFREPGACARYVRRMAELCLQNSDHWLQIEENTRETNEHYKELLRASRVREEAYRTAADILSKIRARPMLLSVWETSCPNLLRSKTRELELQEEGSPTYLEILKEKTRISLVYDAVIALKAIEDERPIRPDDFTSKYDAVAKLANEEQAKIMAQESQLAKELKEIGDGSEMTAKYQTLFEDSIPTNQLALGSQSLLAAPVELFQMTYLEMLDLSHNSIEVLPAEVANLTVLRKLYVNNNRLTTLPTELHKLALSLTLLAAGENPLEPTLLQLYLAGLPTLMAHLKATRRSRRSTRPPATAASRLDLFTTALPEYLR